MVRMVEWVMKEGEGKTADDLGSVSHCVLMICDSADVFQDLHSQLMNLNRHGMA